MEKGGGTDEHQTERLGKPSLRGGSYGAEENEDKGRELWKREARSLLVAIEVNDWLNLTDQR